MISELGNFLLVMALGFAGVQAFTSSFGVVKNNKRYMALGQTSAFLQGGFMGAAFLALLIAFLRCDFSLLVVALHDHTQLPWSFRFAATWGNHEGSLLLFVLVLAGVSVAFAQFLAPPLWRARALTAQGILTVLFLIFLMSTSNPFTPSPFPFLEGKSLNPLLQDKGLLIHPPFLYLGYVGFSAPFSLAIAALWGGEDVKTWGLRVRPWALLAWGALTTGIALGSWWAYYELGWGGWWFWDPVENASFMPWLVGTALLHTLQTGKLYRWSLFLSLLTFSLSLFGTFIVRSGIVTSIHSFAQDPERGLFILLLLGGIVSVSFFLWIWKAPPLQSPPLRFISQEGALLFNSLSLSLSLATILLATLYPLASDFLGGPKISVGAPYFERTLVPLMVPFFILIPIGTLLREKGESLFSLLIIPLTASLGACALILYLLAPLSLWALSGMVIAIWILGGTGVAFLKKRLSLGATLAHLGVGVALLGMSVGGGLRIDETQILKPQERMRVGGITLTLEKVEHGRGPNYRYEKARLSSSKGVLTPEKRLYQPQNSLLSETAILTNGLQDLYVILGPYQGENRWLIRASLIPLAPWIWFGALLMVLGALVSFFKRKPLALLFFLLLPTPSFADGTLEQRAHNLYEEVRCPVCMGQSISDSTTDEAQTLKIFILENLEKGETDETIRQNLRSLYGDAILFRPPAHGPSLFLWLAPFGFFLLLILGFLWKSEEL